MIYTVSASFLYREKGERFERSLNILYQCDTDLEAIVAGIRWGIERGTFWSWEPPVCIKIHHYTIGKPEPSGFIKTGIFSIGCLLEWKYDTSPWSVEQLLDRYAGTKEGAR
jgi:hypothetical protein